MAITVDPPERARPAPPPEPSRNDLGTIARGGALNMAGAVLSGALTFVLFIVLGRGLEPAGYGAFVSAMGLFTILSRTAELGADTGMTRMLARYRATKRVPDLRPTVMAAVVPVLAASVVFGAALWLWAPQLGNAFGKGAGSNQIDDYARTLAWFLPASAVVMVLLSGTRGCGTMIPTNLVDKLFRSALQPVLALGAIWLGLGTTAIAVAFAGPIALAALWAGVWLMAIVRRNEASAGFTGARGRHRARRQARPTRTLAGSFWRFTAPRGFAGVFQIVILWINTLLLGRLDSTASAGIFNAATRYVTAGLMAGVAVQQVMGPKISELLARREIDRAGVVYQTATKWLVTMTWPLYLMFATFSPMLLRVFGAGFEGGETSLIVLGLAMLVATGVGTVDVVLLMGGRSSWNLIDTAVALVVGVVLNVVLIPPLGVTGAAIAWAASILTRNLLSLAQVGYFMKLHPFGFGYWHAAGAALVSYGGLGLAFRLLGGTSIPVFIAYGAMASVLYVGLLRRYRFELELPVMWSELRRYRGGRRSNIAT
ncbi:MAG: lipopolysaccharide biosynthesis protein [Acidimicrobiia bacterium]